MQKVSVLHTQHRRKRQSHPQHHLPTGTIFLLRWGTEWETLPEGTTLDDAEVAAIRKRRSLSLGEEPKPSAPKPKQKPKSDVQTTDKLIDIYLTTGKAAEKDWGKHTLQCHRWALRLFRKSCTKTFLDEITGDDLRQFKVFLRQQKTSTGKKITPRTVYNHFLNVVSFLNAHGRRELVLQSEWLTYEEKKVVSYDPEVMARLLEFATEDERDVLEFFRGVGFRDGEGTHVEWHDIDLRNKEVHVYSKSEQFGWKVKDSEQRIIGISDNLAQRLRARHERHPGDGLVSANSRGKPDTHLLRVIKRVALRAKLNCGKCTGTYERERVSCSTHPVCRRWLIHTMRKTWATFQNRIGTDSPRYRPTSGTARQTPQRGIWPPRIAVASGAGSRSTQRMHSSACRAGTWRNKRPCSNEVNRHVLRRLPNQVVALFGWNVVSIRSPCS